MVCDSEIDFSAAMSRINPTMMSFNCSFSRLREVSFHCLRMLLVLVACLIYSPTILLTCVRGPKIDDAAESGKLVS